MSYAADLHIHSRFSRACSQQLNIPSLIEWAQLKGINVLGTGDFLHPLWLSELKNVLTEDGSGFLTHGSSDIKFVLSVEIASIYSQKGRGRRVHNLVLLPDFASAERFQKTLLSKRANLASDGRPIVGISSKDLLSLALQASDKAIFIPAHVWTPWFGIFGSQSGYDSLKECFEDLTEYIYAVETGLSSDPAMNWRIAELDHRSIVSFSDAHSLPNLGREVTVLAADLEQGYLGLFEALQKEQIAGTIEFYPEEGKYHYTGHRNCHIKYTPDESLQKGTICPVCKRGLTVGVMERVEQLAQRSIEDLEQTKESGVMKSHKFNRPGYRMLVPLLQILAEAFNTAPTTQKVLTEYKKLTSNLGSEMRILTKVDIADIAKISGSKLAEGVEKVRQGDLVIDPGFDGVYGVVKIWNNKEEVKPAQGAVPQLGLFD